MLVLVEAANLVHELSHVVLVGDGRADGEAVLSEVNRRHHDGDIGGLCDLDESLLPEWCCTPRSFWSHHQDHLVDSIECPGHLSNNPTRFGAIHRDSTEAAEEPAERPTKERVFSDVRCLDPEMMKSGQIQHEVPIGCVGSPDDHHLRKVGHLTVK